MTRVSSATLTYDSPSRTFSAFISDLGKAFCFERIYPDACDVGLLLVSSRTGKEATYYLADTISSDGEVQGWVLRPTPKAVAAGLGDTKIKLWND